MKSFFIFIDILILSATSYTCAIFDLCAIHIGLIKPCLNSSPSEQNGCHFHRRHFQCIFMDEKICISIRILLEFVPKGLINNKSVWFQVMVWPRGGDKPSPEPMLAQFTDIYICGTNGEWVKDLIPCSSLGMEAACYQWPLLLTWFNFNPSMDK